MFEKRLIFIKYDMSEFITSNRLHTIQYSELLFEVEALSDSNYVNIACIYFAIRKCIPTTWLNAKDQFMEVSSLQSIISL